jgi:hypothetical protein
VLPSTDVQINGKLTPEQMYAETKFLLFTIIKSLPEKEVNECATVEATLNAAWKWAKEHSDKVLLASRFSRMLQARYM